VAMQPRLFVRLACNYEAHSLLCFLREQPAKMLINAPDRSDRVATDLNIVQVANAVGCQSIALLQKSIQRFRPVIDRLLANYEWIDRIAKHAAKERYETRYGSHRIQQCPLSLEENRLRVNRQE